MKRKITRKRSRRVTVPNTNGIVTFFHCGRCLREKPATVSARDYARLEVGFTVEGIQVWCVRCNCNVLHVHFEGHCHPANTTAQLDLVADLEKPPTVQ